MKRYLLFSGILIFTGFVLFGSVVFPRGNASDDASVLRQENQSLLAAIQRARIFGIPEGASTSLETGVASGTYLTAKVFSTYPFNMKNQITVDAGEEDGVRVGMVVTIGETILLGRVKEVLPTASIVQTVFDSQFEIPVRIGQAEADSLFEGGGEPKAVLIDKTKRVEVGDAVLSADSSFPYGLKVGEITEIREGATGIFKEAIVKTPFVLSEIRDVGILIRE